MIDAHEVYEDGIFKFSIYFDLMEKSLDAFSVFIKKINQIKKRDTFEKFLEPEFNPPFRSALCKYNGCIYSTAFYTKFPYNNICFLLSAWWKEKVDE